MAIYSLTSTEVGSMFDNGASPLPSPISDFYDDISFTPTSTTIEVDAVERAWVLAADFPGSTIQSNLNTIFVFDENGHPTKPPNV